MSDPRHIAVIDIGKTNVKLALVDLPSLTEVAVLSQPNRVRPGPPWPHFDTERHWVFILRGLTQLHSDHGIDAISITTHGASVALLDQQGALAAPILDYEHDGPSATAAAYDAIRPSFAQTGAPRLANGLNIGAQLHWQFQTDPGLHARTAHILTYPQYWGHRLTGQLASDVTSLGCHTDLWLPRKGALSGLVDALDIRQKMTPAHRPGDKLGHILPPIADQTGLSPNTPVACGIHDSNASLYPHLLVERGPFSVVSTGTWVIVMTLGGTDPPLDPARDTLLNVNALGQIVPSARFMGGREFETIQGEHKVEATAADLAQVLDEGLMLLPAVDPTTGPFQGREMRWLGPEPQQGSGQRSAALAFYLALMTQTCLHLTGATGRVIVEGPFARNPPYLSMLAAASGHPVNQSHSATGTSLGATLLHGGSKSVAEPTPFQPVGDLNKLREYARIWRARVGD